MNKFCVDQIVRVIDPIDIYYGRLAKVSNYRLDEYTLVYKYEIKFLEKDPISDRYRVGFYPEYTLSEVEAPANYSLDAIKFYAQNKYYNNFSDVEKRYLNLKKDEKEPLKELEKRYLKKDEKVEPPLRVGDMVEVNDLLDAYYGRKGTIEDITGTIYNDGYEENFYVVRFPPYVGHLPIKRKYSAKDLKFISRNHSYQVKPLSDAEIRYLKDDEKSVKEECYEMIMGYYFGIKKVHFSGPVTCVVFNDGSKAVVRCQEGDTFDPEKGLAMAICKKIYGTNKSGSNYYDKLEKWLPKKEKSVEDISNEITDAIMNGSSKKEVKKLVEESMDIIDSKKPAAGSDNPCLGCQDRARGCLTNCEKLQTYIDTSFPAKESKPDPIKPGYFVEHSKERKEKAKVASNTPPITEKSEPNPLPITMFVEKFEATIFPKEFLDFCKNNDLYFYIVDQIKGGMKKIDPYTVNWQQVTGFLRKGLLESCKKIKYHKNANSTFLAVNMDNALFAKLPVELRGANRKEEK